MLRLESVKEVSYTDCTWLSDVHLTIFIWFYELFLGFSHKCCKTGINKSFKTYNCSFDCDLLLKETLVVLASLCGLDSCVIPSFGVCASCSVCGLKCLSHPVNTHCSGYIVRWIIQLPLFTASHRVLLYILFDYTLLFIYVVVFIGIIHLLEITVQGYVW